MLTFLQNTQVIPAADEQQLKRFPNLDVGERQMLAIFVDEKFECSTLVTGDKRALKQIAGLAACDAHLYQQLEGSVESLEGIMLGLIDRFGFDAINTKVIRGRDFDGFFRLAFGPERDQDHTTSALKSYLASLRNDAPFVVER
jgi:hypothetical protein